MPLSLPKSFPEREEVIGRKLNPQVASDVVRTLIELENVFHTTVYFKYQIINQYPDDDKFINCAISANAHFIVTPDKHFQVLNEIVFPKIKTITLDRLQTILIE